MDYIPNLPLLQLQHVMDIESLKHILKTELQSFRYLANFFNFHDVVISEKYPEAVPFAS